jgi:Transcriptional regulatory protein, C terminal
VAQVLVIDDDPDLLNVCRVGRGRTTTSPSRSACASSTPGCGWRCGIARPNQATARPSCRPARSTSTSSTTRRPSTAATSGLTSREFEFLAYLARSAGKVCTRRMILENVWGPGYAGELNYLKVYAYRIRRKLGDEDGRFLQSDPSIGYRLAWRGN